MKKISRKKHLEIKIQSLPPHPNPKVELEQYSTPADIASDLLWNAKSLGDIENKYILDLGCGCGIFTIGSMLLGAKSACGIDIDNDSIDVAISNMNKLHIDNIEFKVDDVLSLSNDFTVNTIFQNPPFGSQERSDSGIDLKFVKKSVELSPDVLYSFHMASTEDFLIDYYENLSMEITHIFRYDFNIPKIYNFHTKESKEVPVIVLRAIL